MCGRVFFFNDTATTEIYTLSLHDALPISCASSCSQPRRLSSTLSSSFSSFGSVRALGVTGQLPAETTGREKRKPPRRSEEHTSELQSRQYLVCRLLLEKKNITVSHLLSHA